MTTLALDDIDYWNEPANVRDERPQTAAQQPE